MDLESFLAYGILLHHGKSWGINLYKLPKLLTIGCQKNHDKKITFLYIEYMLL